MGVEGNESTQFLGSVVRIAGNVRLHYEDCRKVDKEKKGRHVFNDEVKSRNYDPALSVEEIMERQTDSRVNPEQFQVLVNHWMKPEYQVIANDSTNTQGIQEDD
ncbi:hypothetical protein Tco_1206870 [Tanacetum coccineum]